MSKLLNQIRQIKDSFDFNLENTPDEQFSLSKLVGEGLSQAFSLKGVALASLLGISSVAQAGPLQEVTSFFKGTPSIEAGNYQDISTIEKVYKDSLKIVNINYNEHLPTFNQSVSDLHARKDTIVQNPFWNKNVSTIVFDDIDQNLLSGVDKADYSKQLGILQETKSMYQVIRRLDQEKVDLFYSGVDDYKHFIRFDSDTINIMKERIPERFHPYFVEHIVMHEMAHGSYEQDHSSINRLAEFNLQDGQSKEIHSDLAGALMMAKNENMSAKDFTEYLGAYASMRTYFVQDKSDMLHNSTLALLELRNTIANNPSLYNNMQKEKISSFVGYFTHNLVNNDFSKQSAVFFDRVGYENTILDIQGYLNSYRGKLSDEKAIITPAEGVVKNLLFNEYLKDHPKILEKLADPHTRYDAQVEANTGFVEYVNSMTDKDVTVSAVRVSKAFPKLPFLEVSNLVSSVVGDQYVSKLYKIDSLGAEFKKDVAQVSKVLYSPN